MNAAQRHLLPMGLALLAAAAHAAAPGDLCAPSKCAVRRLPLVFHLESCLLECQVKQGRLAQGSTACPALCEEVRRRATAMVDLECRGDADDDGVQSPKDRCPKTEAFAAVNWTGCPDRDGDTVSDDRDLCPGTAPGARVDLRGCDIAPECTEGDCGTHSAPSCQSPQECDRLAEVPLPADTPRSELDQFVLGALGRKAHPLACPGDGTPPDQPRLTSPSQGINRIQVGSVEVILDDGHVMSGPSLPMTLSWQPVTDPCGPVTYSVYIETYHCHELEGLIEPDAYRARGWCRWMPYLYKSVETPGFTFDFPFGKVLYEVHSAFGPELGWDPHQTGPYPITYMPFWLRARVLAHDANGNASSFGLHADHRYFVLYADESVPLIDLTRIPVAP